MTYAIAYVVALVLFAGLDFLWLANMGAELYRKTLGAILADDIRKLPALAFYLMYPAGLLIFAIAPGLKAGSLSTALIYGALFGLFTYGTYELTNYATLRDWTLQITIIDIVYGMFVSGAVAMIAAFVAPYLASMFD